MVLQYQTSETVGKTNEENTQKPKTVYESVNRDKVIIEDWNSDDEDDVSEVQTVSPVKTNETQTVKTRVDKISQEPKLKTVVNTGPRVDKSVWDNTKRVNHQNFSKYPHLRKTFVPSGVLTRTGLITPVKKMRIRSVHKVCTARPGQSKSCCYGSCSGDCGCSKPYDLATKLIFPTMIDYNGRLCGRLGSDPNETECLILSPSFELLDESQVVLRAPRKDCVYSLDLKNIVPSGGLENQLNHKVKIIRCDHGTEFKNHAMNEFCAKKGIKREFSVARTPQQNGVAERKNRTLIEAARTMLADSLLPIPFWAEAVNTACYVLNRVLVTKPQNKTPYELLIGKPPSISFMRPFGCPLTILNTLDPLGKFDGKSDEGYLLGYSTTSKAFRMFDLDFLTNTMNYIPVSIENQVNMDAGTQEHYVVGSSKKDKEPTQEYILLPLHPYRPRILVEDVIQAAQEKPYENSPKDNDVQDSEDVAEKEEQHTLSEVEQVLKDDLERKIAQEIATKAINDATRQAFEEEKKRATQATSINKLNTGRPSVSTSNSPLVSTANTPYAGANTGGSSFVYLGEQIPIDAYTLPNVDLPIDPNIPDLEDDSTVFPNDGIFSGAYDDEDVGAAADFNNINNTIDVIPIPTFRIHKDHPKGQILGDPKSAVQTRGKIQKASLVQQALVSYIYNQNKTNHKDYQNCLLACFLSQEEPKTISQALEDEIWVEAMQEELHHFKLQRNKRDERSIVVKNKARLVAQGFRQEQGIDYDEVFAPVSRIEAISLFLAFASFMGFPVYQMDVKSAFLYGTIEEEVYVHQPLGFVDPAHPNKVYKVIKALYGLHQAPRAWYETLSSFLLKNGFRRGTIDKTLFIKKNKSDIMLVQVYVDDIIFGSTTQSMCTEFEDCMHKRFQMSSMGELTFFLGLQVKQQPDGIFISQDKYVADILKKFDFCSIKTATTPIASNKPLVKDEDGVDVDVHVYRSMIGSLMYLTASRPDIMFAVCACARFQVTPKASHLNAVKRIFSDYGGASLDRKSTTGGCQFLGRRLISWQCKKQTIVANSTTEAEYVAAANCYGQVLWIQNQMMDYGFNFMNTKIHIDNESTICIVKNPIYHSRTKHIEIQHHFIRDSYEKRLIDVIKIHTDANVADLLTKGFDVTRFIFLVVNIGMINL
ncbi:putative ribonuclease H-like domain-containing protein [Tanacetum coccineum]